MLRKCEHWAGQERIIAHPLDAGFKLKVYRTFRKRPERLLNVLCTFNLRPQSTGHFFAKVSFSTAYLSVNKFDNVCLSETFLYSEFITDDDNLQISGYSIAMVDHTSNKKHGRITKIHYL